jgi:hypothetical protein
LSVVNKEQPHAMAACGLGGACAQRRADLHHGRAVLFQRGAHGTVNFDAAPYQQFCTAQTATGRDVLPSIQAPLDPTPARTAIQAGPQPEAICPPAVESGALAHLTGTRGLTTPATLPGGTRSWPEMGAISRWLRTTIRHCLTGDQRHDAELLARHDPHAFPCVGVNLVVSLCRSRAAPSGPPIPRGVARIR